MWVIYPDVEESCEEDHVLGAGGPGLTILYRGDLEGVTTPGPYFYRDEGPYDGTLGRWTGGLGHELGHGFGLPHPPGCYTARVTSSFVWVIYPDVEESCEEDHELGAGGPGLTIPRRTRNPACARARSRKDSPQQSPSFRIARAA